MGRSGAGQRDHVALWRAALPFLAEPSKRCPPTGCQLLLYYPLFCSAIGRHRDNYNSKQMRQVIKVNDHLPPWWRVITTGEMPTPRLWAPMC